MNTKTSTAYTAPSVLRTGWILSVCCLLACVTLGRGQAPVTPAAPATTITEPVTQPDPFQGFNRAMFRFNDGLVTYAFRPVSRTYQFIVPKPLRRGLSNAFDNVKYPVRFASSLLQGKGRRARNETGKFLINSVAGVGGLFRISERIPALAQIPSEDMGQTLAVWGLPSGPYIVLPLFGPSTPRDFVGVAADFALTPTNWDTIHLGNREWIDRDYRGAIQATEFVSALPMIVEGVETMKETALDPYVAAREAFLAYRKAEIQR